MTIDLLRLCHIDPRSESFVFKNVIPRDDRGQARFDLALPRRVDCHLFESRVNNDAARKIVELQKVALGDQI